MKQTEPIPDPKTTENETVRDSIKHSALFILKGNPCRERREDWVNRQVWRAPKNLRDKTMLENFKERLSHNVVAFGANIPPMIESFKDLRLPKELLSRLESSFPFKELTPFQKLALPTL